MILIIGLSLSFIAIGVLYYLNNELKKKLENNNRALLALQKEFTQYQVNEKRYWEKERAKEEIRHDNIAKCITKNEQLISAVNKKLPEEIRRVIGHIEFARPLDKK
jgi:predicted Holliday junction resolvase-like endonuclease